VRFVDAISMGLRQGMERDGELILMGQDIAEYGGVFKITDGFVEAFGTERVRNTPLCESAILGCAMGLSLEGKPSMVEMQFADFVSCGFNQIVNNLAKTHYRWGSALNVTIRMPTGAGVAAGPFHSQSNEAWFAHVPGLKVVYPATPYDAKGLLASCLNEPNPVLFFEHKYMYRRVSGHVPAAYYELPIGRARHVRAGDEVAVITYGMGVQWAEEAAAKFPDMSLDITDLRSLLPWDREAVFEAVRRTGKVIILHEDTLTGGFGGEIAATITEHCFEYLDGPVTRVGALDTPVPFQADLEQQFLPRDRFFEKLQELAAY
jgi:2-oxoisovalerate dehydrogenase E1 component